MKASSLVVIANTLSRYGYRWVHVMSMAGAVDVAGVRAEYVTAEAEAVARCAWEEKPLGAYHLTLSWGAREVVKLVENGSELNAVMWWIGSRSLLEEGGKATVREAVDLAGTMFELRMSRKAVRALVKKMPKGATMTVCGMELVAAEWVPAGFVVVA